MEWFTRQQMPDGVYTIENIEPGTYNYTVSSEGYEEASGEVSIVDEDVMVVVTLVDPLAVNSLSQADLQIYPSPVQSTLTIRSDDVIHEIRLFNTPGQLIYSSRPEETQYQLDVAAFDSGIYFIRIETRERIATERIYIGR